MDNQKYYTYDLGCASALITAGGDLMGLDRADIRRIGFIFKNNFELEEIINKYWKNQLTVDARSFF